jgi:hypothetical protein
MPVLLENFTMPRTLLVRHVSFDTFWAGSRWWPILINV